MSAYGAIIIDAGLAGQKVKNARDVGENVEKVAYEVALPTERKKQLMSGNALSAL